jgi:hypothetical protein
LGPLSFFQRSHLLRCLVCGFALSNDDSILPGSSFSIEANGVVENKVEIVHFDQDIFAIPAICMWLVDKGHQFTRPGEIASVTDLKRLRRVPTQLMRVSPIEAHARLVLFRVAVVERVAVHRRELVTSDDTVVRRINSNN